MRNVRGGIFKRRWRHKDARVLIDCCMVLAEEIARRGNIYWDRSPWIS